MRLDKPLTFDEAKYWDKLPSTMRNSLPREEFDDDLGERRDEFGVLVQSWLVKASVLNTNWRVVNSGDWHANKRTVVLSCSDEKRVLKARSVSSDVFLGRVLNTVRKETGTRLFVPRLKQYSDFSEQSFFDECVHDFGSATDFAHLLAFSLWSGVTDLHAENVLVNEKSVALIDLDCAFSTSKGVTTSERLHRIGLSFRAQILKQDGLLVKFKPVLETAKFKHSFSEMLAQLYRISDEEFYFAIDKISLRRLFLHTRLYSQFLRKRYLFGWDQEAATLAWHETRKKTKVSAEIINAELVALLRWNVPYFFQIGGDLLELTSKVSVQSNLKPPSIGIKRLHRRLTSPLHRDALYANVESYLNFVSKTYWNAPQ